jgi:predicted O-methyltransferase YrrM
MAMNYIFSDDWFSHNIPLFEQFLGGLRERPCRLLEIGSYEGRSAIWLINNIATHPSSLLETIDANEHPSLRPNLNAAGRPGKITFRLGKSVEVMRTLQLDAYDFTYIDGSHAAVNVIEDAVHAFRLIKKGGIIAFDDYLWDDPRFNTQGHPPSRIKQAIDAFLAIYSDEVELLYRDYQVWVKKKPTL